MGATPEFSVFGTTRGRERGARERGKCRVCVCKLFTCFRFCACVCACASIFFPLLVAIVRFAHPEKGKIEPFIFHFEWAQDNISHFRPKKKGSAREEKKKERKKKIFFFYSISQKHTAYININIGMVQQAWDFVLRGGVLAADMCEAYVAAAAFFLWIVLFKLAALLTPLRRFGDESRSGARRTWSDFFRIASSNDVACVMSLPAYLFAIGTFHTYFPKNRSAQLVEEMRIAPSAHRLLAEVAIGVVLYDFVFWIHLAMHRMPGCFGWSSQAPCASMALSRKHCRPQSRGRFLASGCKYTCAANFALGDRIEAPSIQATAQCRRDIYAR